MNLLFTFLAVVGGIWLVLFVMEIVGILWTYHIMPAVRRKKSGTVTIMATLRTGKTMFNNAATKKKD